MICSRLRCLFSTPAWFTLIRSIAMTFSSCVRKLAVAGESGKKNQNRMDVMKVMTPVIIISLEVSAGVSPGRDCDEKETYHCHGARAPCVICNVP